MNVSAVIDSARPYAFLNEREPFRDEHGNLFEATVSTVFLTARRCPINCAMCDLHQNTFDHKTPLGAIPHQIGFAQKQLEMSNWIKLYNSGNFFDQQSIPPVDYAEIASLCRHYERVIVENHPRLGDSLHRRFRDALDAPLEIAVGLETVQPRWLERLGKQLTRDEFDRYAKRLNRFKIDLRVFLIVGMPDNSVSEAMRWTRLSVRHAVRSGARHISLIPSRAGNGWNGQDDKLPKLTISHYAELFAETLDDVDGGSCVSVDLWDFDPQVIGDKVIRDNERRQLKRFENAILNQDASLL